MIIGAILYITIGSLFTLWMLSFHKDPTAIGFTIWMWLLVILMWPYGVFYFVVNIIRGAINARHYRS